MLKRVAISTLTVLILVVLFVFVAFRAFVPTSLTSELRRSFESAVIHLPELPEHVPLAFSTAIDPDFYVTPRLTSPITKYLVTLYARQEAPDRRMSPTGQIALGSAFAAEFSHDELMLWLVSKAYLGLGCFGVANASQAHFATPIQDIDLSRIALLTALSKATTHLNLERAPDLVLAERNAILKGMETMGAMGPDVIVQAISMPLQVQSPLPKCD